MAAAALGRLAYGSLSLALLYLVHHATGSYGSAGLVSGAFAAATLTAPLKSRLIDRRSPRLIVACLACAYTTFLCGLILMAAAGTHQVGPFIPIATAAGLTAPPIGPAVRARWAKLTADAAELRRAYSLDVATEDLLFLVGPVLSGALLAIGGATAPMAATAALALTGNLIFAATSSGHDRPAPHPPQAKPRPSSKARPTSSLTTTLAAVAAASLGAATVEISVTSKAISQHQGPAAGYLLAITAGSSAVAGLVAGRRPASPRIPQQLAAYLLILAGGLIGASAVKDLYLLVLTLILVGAAQAPILVTAYLAADQQSGEGRKAEASSWISTTWNATGAMSVILAGEIISHATPTAALLIAATLVTATAVLASILNRRTGHAPEREA